MMMERKAQISFKELVFWQYDIQTLLLMMAKIYIL